MKDLIKIKNYLESQKDYYENKGRIIKEMGDKATPEDNEMRAFYFGKVAAFMDALGMVNYAIALAKEAEE